MDIERKCGDCAACCWVISVDSGEVQNGPSEQCEHQLVQIGSGPETGQCGIYENRPSACRQYTCSWLEGLVRLEDSPLEIGALFETVAISADGEPREKAMRFHMAFVFDRQKWKERGPAAMQAVCESEGHPPIWVTYADDLEDERGEQSVFGEKENAHRLIQFIAQSRRYGLAADMADGRIYYGPDGVSK